MANNRDQYLHALVIGGSGFIGYHLIDSLVANGMVVISVDINQPRIRHAEVTYHEGDFTSRKFMAPHFRSCDVVYHLASTTLPKSSNDDPQYDITSNLLGTVSLLDLAVTNKVKKFIYVSSGGTIYGVPEYLPVDELHRTNPECSYGIVKLAVEKYLRMYSKLYGLNSTSLRVSNPYGEYQRVDRAQGAIAVFCHKALQGETIEIWGDGSVVRDFIYVKDVVAALLNCLQTNITTDVINVGYGKGVSLNELLSHIEEVLERPVSRTYQPGRCFDVPEIFLDITKADKFLDWRPEVELKEGISRMLSWMKSQ